MEHSRILFLFTTRIIFQNLQQFLDTKAVHVKQFYESNKNLSRSIRKNFIHLLATSLVNEDKVFGTKEAALLTYDIVKVFPGENSVFFVIFSPLHIHATDLPS